MAPTETSQSQKMIPAGKLRSMYGVCQPCSLDHHHFSHKTCRGDAEWHNTNTTRRSLKPADPPRHQTDHKAKPQHNDADEHEARLWTVGCMSVVFTLILYLYGSTMLLDQLPKDPRVDSWLFMQSPLPTLLVCLAYIAFCTYFGPRLMRGRERPMGLKHIMVLYNAFQVVFSAWMFYEGGMGGWFGSYSFICQPCDFSNSPQALRMLNVALWYNLSKFIDFLDTIFFVVNKKYGHISLLHITHHSLMPIAVWYGVRHEAGGQTTFFGFLNCFVHTVMYLYYLLAAMGPRVRPYLWWKKYLTKMQMVQFVTMFVHASVSMSFGCQAGAPLMRMILVMAAIFQLLFTDFYIKAYLNRASSQNKKKPIEFPVFCTTLNNHEPRILLKNTPTSTAPTIIPTHSKSQEVQAVRHRLRSI